MRLIGGILRLDGTDARVSDLDRMALALTGSLTDATPRFCCDGPAGLFELWTGASDNPSPVDPEGWLVAADIRLDRPVANERQALVEAVDRHGVDFPDRVDGDLAVALWRSSERRLWLGRDFAGVRPLAWCCRPGRFLAFASAPRALTGAGLASGRPDLEAIALRYMLGYFPEGSSGLEAIHQLPPGWCLTMSPVDSEPRLHQAWRPDLASIGRWPHGPQAAAEELRSRITRAVSVRLPSTGGVISQLSGGLDSSSVTVVAARALRDRRAPLFASGYIKGLGSHPDEDTGDGILVRAVLRQEPSVEWFDVPPTVDQGAFNPDLPDAAWDEHLPGLQAEARRRGISHILTGFGGDQAASYNGADLYAALFRQMRWSRLHGALRVRARRDRQSLGRTTLRLVARPMLPPGLRDLVERARGRARTINPRFLHLRPDYQARAQAYIDAERTVGVPIRLRAFTRGKLADRSLSLALRGLPDGVRYLHPLLDRRVVDLALALPVHFLIGEGQTRLVFRKAMEGILPPIVKNWPDKQGAPVEEVRVLRLRRFAALEALEEVRGDPAACSVFNVPAIEAVLRSAPDGALGRSDVRLAWRAGRLAAHLAHLNRLSASKGSGPGEGHAE